MAKLSTSTSDILKIVEKQRKKRKLEQQLYEEPEEEEEVSPPKTVSNQTETEPQKPSLIETGQIPRY